MQKNKIEKVYHYCSTETFLNIIRNRTIRLSDINKSNDYLELKAMCSLVINEVKSLAKKDIIFSGFNGLISGMNDYDAIISVATLLLERMMKYNDVLCYAACFSEEPDLLSQWCRYADDGKGISIGFDVDVLKNICKEIGVCKFDKVTYVGNQNNQSNIDIAEVASQLLGIICGYIDAGRMGGLLKTNGIVGGFEGILIKILFRDCFFIKSEQFSEEREWRFALSDDVYRSDDWVDLYNWKNGDTKDKRIYQLIPNGLDFRATPDNIISFMDLNFSEFIDECLIKEIIIGPKSKIEVDDIHQILQHFFRYDGDVDNIVIYKSKVSLQ